MQDWKKAEQDFVNHFKAMGKRASCHRLVDTAMAKALGGKNAFMPEQPSDYIIVLDSQTFFAEVKHTVDEDRFHFSNIRKGQMVASRKIVKAGGLYFLFIKSAHLNQWFCVPAHVVHMAKEERRGSLTWTEMEPYKYDL